MGTKLILWERILFRGNEIYKFVGKILFLMGTNFILWEEINFMGTKLILWELILFRWNEF